MLIADHITGAESGPRHMSADKGISEPSRLLKIMSIGMVTWSAVSGSSLSAARS